MITEEQRKRLLYLVASLTVTLENMAYQAKVLQSVRADRMYIGISNETTDEHYAIQVDVL